MELAYLIGVRKGAAPADTVARSISGHRTASVHDRYQITQEAAKKAALAAMTARVAEQVRGS